jgi:tetratricopeptide (TPR) repeat protein
VVGTVEAQLTLADYYLAIGKVDQCLTLLRTVSATKEGYAAGRIRTAMIDYASGKRQEAHAILREVLAKDPQNGSALAIDGRILLADHKVDEALALANTALTADARNVQAYVTLGYVQLARGDRESARKAFAEALNFDPARSEAQIELAKIHYERRELDTSIAYAEKGIKDDPSNLDARLILVRSLTVRPDDLPRAKAELTALLAHYPRSAPVWAMQGVYFLRQQDPASARRAFTEALQFDPDNVEALGGLAALDFEAKRPDDARRRIEARLAATKQPSADLLLLAVKTYSTVRDAAKTEATLKRLVDLDPANLESVNLLGQFYVATRQLDAAKAQYTSIVAKEPKSVTAQTVLGLLHQASGDTAAAKKAYEAAVTANPRAAAAANNLAWLYATTGGSLDVALQLALSARAEMPDSADIADTVGYIYYKKDMPGFAIPALTQSLTKDPKNPTYLLHMGLVYAAAGEDAKARDVLTRALKISGTFDGADEARRTLTKLVY